MVCFQTQNPIFGKNLVGLEIKNVVIFYDLLEYFTAIWYNLQLCGIVCGHFEYFFRFGMFGPRKIWQPCSAHVPMSPRRNAKDSYVEFRFDWVYSFV
jgi:hypothetical protein